MIDEYAGKSHEEILQINSRREFNNSMDRIRQGKTSSDRIALARLEVDQINLEIQRAHASYKRNGASIPEFGPGGNIIGYKRDKSVPFTIHPTVKERLDRTKRYLSDLEQSHFQKTAQDKIDAARKNILNRNNPTNAATRSTGPSAPVKKPEPPVLSVRDRQYNAMQQNLAAQGKLIDDYRKIGKSPPWSEFQDLNGRFGSVDKKFMQQYEADKQAEASKTKPKGKHKPAKLKRPKKR